MEVEFKNPCTLEVAVKNKGAAVRNSIAYTNAVDQDHDRDFGQSDLRFEPDMPDVSK